MQFKYDNEWMLAVLEDLIAFSAENEMDHTRQALAAALQTARLENEHYFDPKLRVVGE